MNILEKNMVGILKDLKENHHVTGVKAEFETEGTRLEEALRLKKITSKAGLDLTIKIGGCGAVKDMYDVKTIGVSRIIAPMTETPYAVKKFILSTKSVFSDVEIKNIDFLINIETITGYNNLNDIITSEEFSELSGIVLGRDDMTGSMGLTRKDINSEQIYNIAHSMSEKIMATNKDFVVGGSVSTSSLPFFKKLPYLTKFETRKVIFDAQAELNNPNVDKGILKAVEFELLWLKNKRDLYGIILKDDETRITMLEKFIKEADGIFA